MNLEQLYQSNRNRIMPTVQSETVYNVGKRWSIADGCLYFVKAEGDHYQLYRVSLQNTGAREPLAVLTSPVSYAQGGDFGVICAADAIFVYRILSEKDYLGKPQKTGVELFRWEQKEGTAMPLERKLIRTDKRVVGFDLQNIYCAKKRRGSYSICAIDILTGAERTLYEERNKELGRVWVLKGSIVTYDYEYDDDSVSSPITDQSYRIILKNTGKVRTLDAMHYLLDPENGLAWEREKSGGAEYLIPYRLTSLFTNAGPSPHFVPGWKLPLGTLIGQPTDFYFNGTTLLVCRSRVLTAYDQWGEGVRLAADCCDFGIAGGYIYMDSKDAKLCPQRQRHARISVEEIIGS